MPRLSRAAASTINHPAYAFGSADQAPIVPATISSSANAEKSWPYTVTRSSSPALSRLAVTPAASEPNEKNT